MLFINKYKYKKHSKVGIEMADYVKQEVVYPIPTAFS